MHISSARFRFALFALSFVSFGFSPRAIAQEEPWFDRQTEWKGYDQFHFTIAERPAYVVAPKKVAAGKPWVWRARFPGFHAEMDVALLGKGFHLAYVDVAGMFGSPRAIKVGDAIYEYLTTKHGFAKKPALEGVSRGGLFVYNWAANNPDKVACIYCDAPVCDFKSWPGGKGQGVGAEKEWEQCKKVYGLAEDEALKYDRNPVDLANIIASARIPLMHIVSESDVVVPPKENTYLLRDRLQQQGHQMEIISVAKGTAQSKGHHFDHPEPDRVVNFITKHASVQTNERMALLAESKRIVLLGDSVTFAGHHWVFFDAWLQTQALDKHPILINAGLPSETVSGLSEEGHAGGRFPRPDLAERLERVLDVTKPDLVIACYGINCGIYQPFDEDRFESYQNGIHNLRKHVEKAGAKLVLVTPPSFDDQRGKKTFSYNAVIDRYSDWLLSQRENGWAVIDLHGPMTNALAQKRKTDSEFTFQPDAVHPNMDGYWFVASKLIRWFGDDDAANSKSPEAMMHKRGLTPEKFDAVRERMELRRNAYVGAAGHKRPGVKAGLPIEKAEEQAKALTEEIESR